jgi:hypothetical protein
MVVGESKSALEKDSVDPIDYGRGPISKRGWIRGGMSRISCCRRLHRRPRSILCTAVLSDHVLFLLLTGFCFVLLTTKRKMCHHTLGAVSDLNRTVQQGRESCKK